MRKSKVIVVMPAYNAALTIQKTYNRIPKNLVDEILVVDDASKDSTTNIVKKLGLKLIIHPKNLGYGGNQKTCYKNALKLGADIIVMLHPDYQYDPKFIRHLIAPIIDSSFDIMLGSRIRMRSETLRNGMPLYKYISNRILTLLENVALGLNLTEYHTGYRAYSRRVLEKLNIDKFSNNFIFDQQILFASHVKGFRIGEIFTPCKYRKDSSSTSFKSSVRYGLELLINLLIYTLNKKSFVSKN